MPRFATNTRVPVTIALLVVPLACLGLGACGSSSKKPSASASTAAMPATTASTSTAPASTTPSTTTSKEPTITTSRQFTAVYECMRHNGIGLPPLKSMKSIGEIKINTNTPQYQSTLTKCRHQVLG